MDHDLVQAALRVLKAIADHQPPSAQDIELLRTRLPDVQPNTRADDLACQAIQNELAKSRKVKVLTATGLNSQ